MRCVAWNFESVISELNSENIHFILNLGPLGTGVLFEKVTDEQAEEDEQ